MTESERRTKAFKDFRHDYKKAKSAKTEIDGLISDWNDLYYGKGNKNSNTNGSKIVMKEIAKQIEWQKPNISEPFIGTSHPIRISGNIPSSQKRIIQKYANNQFTNDFDRDTFINQLTDVMIREGTVWTRTSWKFEEELQEDNFPSMTMQEILERSQLGEDPSKIEQNKSKAGQPETFNVIYASYSDLDNKPFVEVCRNEHIFPDPAARSEQELRFVIHRRYETLSDLRASGKYDEEDLDRLKDKISAGDDTILGSARDSDSQSNGVDATSQTQDSVRQKIEILEYWGYYDFDGDGIAEPIMASWSAKHDVDLMLEDNPMPSKKIPFQRAVYSERSYSLWGNALAFFLGDNQKAKTGLVRGIIDNMSLANNGQKLIQQGGLDYVNFKRLRNKERHVFTTKNPKDIVYEVKHNSVSSDVFSSIQMFNNETEQLSGVGAGGPALTQGSLNKDDNGDMQLTMSQQRMAGTVRNIANLMGKVVFEWITMAENWLTNEQVESLFSENEQADYYAFRSSKRAGVSCKVGTEVVRGMKLKQLNMLMQQAKVLGEKTPPGTIESLTAEMFELFDKYDEAEAIRNYKPEPDPMAQMIQELELKKLKLELAKLETDIRNSQTEGQLNVAKAENERADAISTLKYKEAQSAEKWAKTEGHGVDSALKPAKAVAEIDSILKSANSTRI